MSDPRTSDALRRMVREVLQEVLPHHGSALPVPAAPPTAAPPAAGSPDVRRVRVDDDGDLADVVTQVLNLAEDPDRAADLRAGRIRFSLHPGETSTAGTPRPLDVVRGAVTERVVQQAAREQRPLRIGPRAVITPLARDRARALGVTIDRSSTEGKEPR
jgi:hypothetical protein